ncbi:helix-turn-helix domain-containing protein [Polymorphospora sp. NPDC051019]|uniref:helix-turn-helix domain-containing protein n=1 Tax=Polymorphospora sp. NPDC051019 TaxID=3155725 RepID=UPI003426A5E5
MSASARRRDTPGRYAQRRSAATARDVGYGSESAFSVAFKRVVGTSPRAYRQRFPRVT